MRFARILTIGRRESVSAEERAEEIEIEKNPPKCSECDRPAAYCLLSEHPVCSDCFAGVLEEWRALHPKVTA